MAEGARLESVYTGNRIVGSNPTPSATSEQKGHAGRSRFYARGARLDMGFDELAAEPAMRFNLRF